MANRNRKAHSARPLPEMPPMLATPPDPLPKATITPTLASTPTPIPTSAPVVAPISAAASDPITPPRSSRIPRLIARSPHAEWNFVRRFGQMVRQARHRCGYTQQELAFRSKLHPAQITLTETGARSCRLQIIYRLAAGLGVEPAEIMPPITAPANDQPPAG